MAELENASITELFEEYRRAREAGEPSDVQELLQRAGPERTDLEARIRVFEDLRGLSDQLEDELAHPPQSLGRFRIIESLGAGGLSRVYLAHDPELDRQVALKILGRGLHLRSEERVWILNEARTLARLEHPGVVRVFDVGSAEDCDFIAMELVDGPSLADVMHELRCLERGRPADPERERARALAEGLRTIHARTVCLQRLAGALAYCHNRGVIHRDVKPENVLFDADGQPKLIDFGLAHLVDAEESEHLQITRQLVGSAAYVAPEQVEHGRTGADPRSDQFSFSTLCYEFLSLQSPFQSATTTETMQAIARSEPRSLRRLVPSVSEDLERVVHHGLQREPDARYPTVHALADDLAAVLEHRPISVSPPTAMRSLALWTKRHRRLVFAAGGVVGLALAFLIGGWVTRTLREKSRVEEELARLDLAGLGDTGELFDAALDLYGLQADAEAFDAGLGRAWLAGPLRTDVQGAVHAWSRRLGEHFSTVEEDGADLPLWRQLFRFEERICPDCPYNLAERERGRVFLPLREMQGLSFELLRMRRPDGEGALFTTLQAVEPVEELRTGAYRLRAWVPGERSLAAELDFFVAEEWGPAIRVPFNLPRTDVLARTALVHRREIDQRALFPGSPEGRIAVPAFRITEDPVTSGELHRFLHATGYAPAELDETRGDDEPAWADLDTAMAYATWAGGRLPGLVELYLSLHDDLVPLPEARRTREWLADLHWLNENSGSFFVYVEFRDSGRIDRCFAMNPSRATIPWDRDLGVQFRVVFPADDPAFYHQRAGEPR